MASSNIIGIPTDEKAFEENCIPLFAGLLGDPNVKLVGTRGKKQWGVDLIGRRNRDPRQPVGIQCKLVTRGGKLTEKIVRAEVTQAMTIKPALTEFYIVTTATDEPALDLLAMELAAEQAVAGRTIDIQVWGWDTLQQKIRADPQALNAFDPDYSAATGKLVALGTETLEGQAALRADVEQLRSGMDELRAGIAIGALDTARSVAFEAARFVRAARGNGAALDTLTVWHLHRLGHLAAARRYFGRLCIARSTFDDLLEMRADIALNRGREFMTVGFEGDRAYHQIHTVEDTEARLALVDDAIADIGAICDVLPVDGGDDHGLEDELGRYAAGQLLDAIRIACEQDVILISEDLNLRQYAAKFGVKGGAWLQVTLNLMGSDDAITDTDYLVAVGVLAAMRHDHVWLDAPTMLGLLKLDDPRSFALFEAAIGFIGGKKAEMRSHLTVAIDFMTRVWGLDLPGWQKGRAIGRLLTRFVNSRRDWKAVLYIIDADLAERANRGLVGAREAHNYLVGWIAGHFYDLNAIRSPEKIIEELHPSGPMRRARSPSERGKRRGRRKRA